MKLFLFLELVWQSPFMPLYHSTEMFLSLPGSLLHFYLNVTRVEPQNNLSMHITWISNKITNNTFIFKSSSRECKLLQYQSETCSTFITYSEHKQTTYFIIGYIKYLYDQYYITKIRKTNKSWNEASDICEEIGAHLPYFNSQDDLDEFKDFLKQPHHVPLMDMVFIGLRSLSHKVGNFQLYPAVAGSLDSTYVNEGLPDEYPCLHLDLDNMGK